MHISVAVLLQPPATHSLTPGRGISMGGLRALIATKAAHLFRKTPLPPPPATTTTGTGTQLRGLRGR
jgi:hypothetical protein